MVQIKGEESVDFGGSFTNPKPGEHTMIFLTDVLGIQTNTNDEGEEKESFVMDLAVIDDPDEEQNDCKVRKYLPVGEDWAEEQLCHVLTCAGVAADIEKAVNNKYPDNDFSVFDDEVIEQIQMKLPGNCVSCITSIRKWKEKKYGQIDHMEILNTQKSSSTRSSSSGQSRRRRSK